MMKRYVIADAAGEIVRTTWCLESMAELQAHVGETMIESADANSLTHRVVSGALVAYTQEQQQRKMGRRDEARWDNGAMDWIDMRQLGEVKSAQAKLLRAAALAAANADLTVQGVTFAVSQDIRAELAQELALAQAEGAGYSLDWERANGNAITLTGNQVRGLLRAMSNRAQAIRATLRAKLAAVQAAATIAEVEAVAWA